MRELLGIESKICGMPDVKSAKRVIRMQPTAVGFYCWPKEERGGTPVTRKEAKIISEYASSHDVDSCMVTYETIPDKIFETCLDVGCTAVQLVGKIATEDLAMLAKETDRHPPHLSIIKSMGVVGVRSIYQMLMYEEKNFPYIDALLLDSYSSTSNGGTGKVHDWPTSDVISDALIDFYNRLPFWLAGGINLSNLQQAMDEVRPDGIDIESGVRNKDRSINFKAVGEVIEKTRTWTPPLPYA